MPGINNTRISVVLQDIRSTHNVGAILRTAEGMRISHVYMTGYTPYPAMGENDERLPHVAEKNTAAIRKTALGAENQVSWSHEKSLEKLIHSLRDNGSTVYALEQDTDAIPLHAVRPQPQEDIVLIAGNEVDGLPASILNICDSVVEIPMLGSKESFNVSVAVGMALHWFRYVP